MYQEFYKTFSTSFVTHISNVIWYFIKFLHSASCIVIPVIFRIQSLRTGWRDKRVHISFTTNGSRKEEQGRANTPISLCASKISDRISNNTEFRFLGIVLALLDDPWGMIYRERSRSNIENSKMHRWEWANIQHSCPAVYAFKELCRSGKENQLIERITIWNIRHICRVYLKST